MIRFNFSIFAYVILVAGVGILAAEDINRPALQDSAEKLTGKVVTADGKAVSGGQVAVATTRKTVYIKNGGVMFEGYGSSKNKVVETDEDGMFDLGDIPDVTYAVVACHESGWAIVEDVDYQKNKTIELRPWGGVKGKLANYKEIGSNSIFLSGLPNSTMMKHSISCKYQINTLTDGVFEIDKLPEGMYEVGYYTRIFYSGGGTYTCRTPVRVKSGQISDMTIGGDGRTVKGKFVTPEGYKGKMYFGEGVRSLCIDSPEEPRPDNYQEMSSKEKIEWRQKWRFTDSYYKWQNSWINENWRHYAFRIEKDGSFTIRDVLPGKYGFYVDFEDDLFGPGSGEELGGYYKDIEIPEAADGSDEPYDCGELEIEVRNTYHIGDDAPLFEYKTLAGETVRLADLKGKVVLLDLWYSNMTRNRPKIQAAYDKYKDDPRLVILGICLDKNRKEMEDYLAKNPTDWPQIYDKQKKILTDYGEYAPVLVLIGADGKLLSRWLELRGDRKLQPLLDETMGRLKPENKPKEKRAVYDVELQFLSIDMEKVGIDFSKIEANGWTIDDIQADFIKEAVKAAENSLSIFVPEFEAVESEQNDFSDSEGIVTNNDKLEFDKLVVTLDEAENNRLSLAFELEYAHESGKFADADKTLSMMSVQSFSNTIRIPEGKRVIMPLGGMMDIQYYVMVKTDVKTKYKGSSIKDEKKEIKNSELRIKKEEDGREAIGNRESAIGEGIDDGRAESVDLDTEKAGNVVSDEVNNWGFGKVKEIICSANVVDGLTYIELDSGKVYTDKKAENGVEPENYDVSKSNIIVTVDKDGNYKLTTKDMAFVHAANREWVTSSVSEVVNNNELNNSQAIWTSNKGNKDQLPETWYFKTWAGENYGIVQISEYIEKANGFKLQYKLVDKTVKIQPKRCLVVFSGIELDKAAIVKDFFDKNGLKLEIVSRKGTKGYTLVTHDGFAWTKDDEFRELRGSVKLVGSLYSLWYKEGWPRITNKTFESAYPIDTDRLEYIEDNNVEGKSEGNRIKAKVGVFVSLYSAKGPSWWQGSEIGFFHARIAEMFNDPQEYDLYALVDPGTENAPAIKEIMAEIGFPGNKCLNAASVEDLQKVDVMVSGNWHVNITWEILDAITEAVGRGVHLVNYEHFGLIRPAYATGEEATQATWASHMNAVIRSNPEEVEKYKDRITLLFGLKRPQFVWHLSNVKWKLKKNHPIFDYLNKDDMIVSAGINGLVGYNEGEKTFELVDDEITDRWNGRKVSRNELDVFSVHSYGNGLVVNLPLLGDLPSYGMRDQFHCVRHCVDWVAGQKGEESEELRTKSEELWSPPAAEADLMPDGEGIDDGRDENNSVGSSEQSSEICPPYRPGLDDAGWDDSVLKTEVRGAYVKGEGRPVRGKFVTPKSYKGNMYFGNGRWSLQTFRPEKPKPENYDTMTVKEQSEWYKKWRKSDECAKWEATWKNERWRAYDFHPKHDGSFIIDDVLPGKYQFYVGVDSEFKEGIPYDEVASYNGTLVVPEHISGNKTPFDCGELVLKIRLNSIDKNVKATNKEMKDNNITLQTVELPGIGKIPVYASNDPNDMHSKLRQAIADKGEIEEDTSILKAIGAWSLSYEDWDNNIYIGGPIEWSSYHNNWYGYYYDREEYEQYRNRLYDPEFSGKRMRASYTIEWDKKD